MCHEVLRIALQKQNLKALNLLSDKKRIIHIVVIKSKAIKQEIY